MRIREMERTFNLEKYLKKFKPKISGDERLLPCPECAPLGKDRKLWINVKRKQGICYHCDISLSAPLAIIQFIEGLPLVEAIRVLEIGASNTARDLSTIVTELLKDETIQEEDSGKLARIKLPSAFTSYKDANRIPKYFKERGISKARALRYRLGFCPYGYYFNRLVVPSYMNGKLVSFQARYMKKEPPKGTKKTLFPPGAKTGRILFNYDVAKASKTFVIVEDPFSAMAVGQSSVATFGTRLSDAQLGLLLQAQAKEIIICWDRDAFDKANDLGTRLEAFGVRVRVAKLRDERDPDELNADELARILSSASAATLATSLRERLGSGFFRVPIEA